MDSQQTIRQIRSQTDTVMLAFSRGKDAIAAWLELRKHFRRIVPFYMWDIPGLGFVERSLAYYEGFFGCHIHRIPHPSIYRYLNNFVFQPPERCAIIDAVDPPTSDYDEIIGILKDELGLGSEVYVANGVRAADSPNRRASIMRYGAINDARGTFMPIWDWNKARLIDEIKASGVKLPIDYRIFGRSWDGLDYRFVAPLKQYLPDDYQRVLDWFPLVELEIVRMEYAARR